MAPPKGIYEISGQLARLAAEGAEPHLIDTEKEWGAAVRIIEQELRQREGLSDEFVDCEGSILEDGYEALDGGESFERGRRYQTNQLFSDLVDYRCNGDFISKFFRKFWFGMDLIAEIDDHAYISIDVYSGGGGRWNTERDDVQLTRLEWDSIISPLTAIPHQGSTAAQERVALKGVVAQFEKVVGPKAGTKDDKGGSVGNKYMSFGGDGIHERGVSLPSGTRIQPAAGQQDCINEMQTTRGLINLLLRQQLLVHHELAPDQSFAEVVDNSLPEKPILHVATVLQEKQTSVKWVVDSWPRDNGQPPDIMELSAWTAYWFPKLKMKEPIGPNLFMPELFKAK